MITLIFVLLLGQTAPPDLGTRKSGADWPGFLGPNRDGKSPEKGILKSWPGAGPRLVWQKSMGESFGSASVSRGRLFHFDRFGEKARLTCMNSETGKELWRFEYTIDYTNAFGSNNGPRCCPVVDGDRVYIFGPAGRLHCVRIADGTLVWKNDTSREYGVVPNFFGVGSTPIVEGELLIVQVGGSPADSPPLTSGELKGSGSGIVAFDKRTGKQKYAITDELASYASPVTVTIDGRRWCFMHCRGSLVGFNPVTGKVDFEYPWRDAGLYTVNICSPVVVGDRVFVSEAYGIGSSVLKVKPGGYDVVWKDGKKRNLSMAALWNTPVHVDGHLYGSSGVQGAAGELRCIELETGKIKWARKGLTRTSLLYVDGHFVGLGDNGTLRLIKVSSEKYVEVASVPGLVRSPAKAAPILSHGLLYVRGSNRLVCLELIPSER